MAASERNGSHSISEAATSLMSPIKVNNNHRDILIDATTAGSYGLQHLKEKPGSVTTFELSTGSWFLRPSPRRLGWVATAERDIQRRPADQVRGNKLFWRFVCLNAVGSASYFRWGRRAPQQ